MNFKIKISILATMLFLGTSGLMAQANKKKKVENKVSEATTRQVLELKTRPLSLLFKTASLSVEKQINKTISAELTGSYLWGMPFSQLFSGLGSEYDFNSTGLSGNLNVRYYFNDSNKGLDRFYTGAYMAGGSQKLDITYISSTSTENERIKTERFALGFLAGYKIVSRDNKVSFDFTGGLGRALFNKTTYLSQNSTIDEEGFTGSLNLDGFLNFKIGYRL